MLMDRINLVLAAFACMLGVGGMLSTSYLVAKIRSLEDHTDAPKKGRAESYHISAMYAVGFICFLMIVVPFVFSWLSQPSGRTP